MTVSVAMRYREGKKAMKSLIGGMSSFRMATFLSVILVPIVSFMKPIMGVGSAITLLFQAYVCARIGMEYCKSNTDKSIAGIMAAVLAFKGSGWALWWDLPLTSFCPTWNSRRSSWAFLRRKNWKPLIAREMRKSAAWPSKERQKRGKRSKELLL